MGLELGSHRNMTLLAGAGAAMLLVSACGVATSDSSAPAPPSASKLSAAPVADAPNICTQASQAPDCVWPVPVGMIHAGVPDGANSNARFFSAQVNTVKQYAWGKWTARMKASVVPGVISAFFLFNEKAGEAGAPAWPANWHEPDFEVTTGMRSPASTSMLGPWASTAKGGETGSTKRYDRQYYIPKEGGPVQPMTNLKKSQRDQMLSLNNFAVNDQGKSAASNRQVSVDTGKKLGEDYHDYTFYYTPGGIWWELDGKVLHGNQSPTEPIKNQADVGAQQFVSETDMDAMAQGGGKINAYFNIWNGAFPDSQYWGGGIVPPLAPANLNVEKLQFWTFTPSACTDQASCTASGSFSATPELVSDFANQTYTDGGQPVSFTDMWKSRSAYIKALGSEFKADGVKVPTSTGSPLTLTMQPRTDVKTMRFVNTNGVPAQVNYKSAGTARNNPAGTEENWVDLGTFPGGVANNVVIPDDTTEINVSSGAPFYYAICHITDIDSLEAGKSYNLNPDAPWGPDVICKTN